MLAGYDGNEGEHWDFALARYNAKGSLDATFGTGGKVGTNYVGFNSRANDLTIQADGKINERYHPLAR